MSKQKKHSHKKKEPPTNTYAHMNPRRQKLHLMADEISYKFAKMLTKINRVLLAVFAVIVALLLFKVLPSQTARYLIIAVFGAALAMNGIAGYRQSKWAGFFLMVFGTLLCLGNLIMLGQ
ncbi:MAG: hypothetical protein IKU58_09160 [Clostridia bacterium]|nr:hypothetical protein [Clostridia bacterium]